MNKIKEIAVEVAELVEKKNKDYGNSFDKTSTAISLILFITFHLLTI